MAPSTVPCENVTWFSLCERSRHVHVHAAKGVRGPREQARAERERASVTRRGEYARGEGDGQQSGQQHESQHSGTLRATSKKSDGRNSRRGVRVSGGAATATAAAAGEEHKELKSTSSRSRGRGPKAPPKSRPRSAPHRPTDDCRCCSLAAAGSRWHSDQCCALAACVLVYLWHLVVTDA